MGDTRVTAFGFVAACFVAAMALAGRGSSGLPDLLLEVPLGGQMKINTADGPMLVNVANQMRCQQCASAFGNMHGCPCSVDVTGSKDGQYYEGDRVTLVGRAEADKCWLHPPGVIKVTNLDKAKASGSSGPEEPNWIPDGDEGDNDEKYRRAMKGCHTKPLHLRVTAKGSFLDGVPVFPGDAKTEGMLEQLFHFFGPDKAGLVMDGTLTCKQQWNLEHPDYLIPKPGYPSDVAVKIPHGSTLEPLKDELAPFKTMIPQVLRQKYGEGSASRSLREGLEGAMHSNLFQRDAAQFRTREEQESKDSPDFATPRGNGRGSRVRHQSMKAMLRELSEKVNRLSESQEDMGKTLKRADGLMGFGRH